MTNSIPDIAETGQVWASAFFTQDREPQVPWLAEINGSQWGGMMVNTHRNTVLLSYWQPLTQTLQSLPDSALDPLLRYTFDNRQDDIRVAVLDTDLGVGLTLPVWRPDDAGAYTQAFEAMATDLASWQNQLAVEGETDWDAAQLTHSATPSLTGSSQTVQADPALARQKLATMADICGLEPLPTDQNFFELLFDDLPVRVSLHPANHLATVDLYLYDASVLQGLLRRAVMGAALQLNRAGVQGIPLAIGLDRRHFMVASAYAPITDMPELLLPWLQYLVEQSFSIRQLIRTIAMDGAEISFSTRYTPVPEEQ